MPNTIANGVSNDALLDDNQAPRHQGLCALSAVGGVKSRLASLQHDEKTPNPKAAYSASLACVGKKGLTKRKSKPAPSWEERH